MSKKKFLLFAVICTGVLCAYLSYNNKSEFTKDLAKKDVVKNYQNSTTSNKNTVNKNNVVKQSNKQTNTKTATTAEKIYKKTNLYSDMPSNTIPLSGIYEISDLSQDVRNSVETVMNSSSGIYLIKRHKNKLTIISESNDNLRQGVDFTEISIKTGHQNKAHKI